MYQFSLSWFYSIFQSCLGGVSTENANRPPSIVIGESSLSVNDILSPRLSAGTLRPGKRLSEASVNSILTNPNQNGPASNPDGKNSSQQTESEFEAYIESILHFLTHTVYQVVSWALFAEHQLIFSFSLIINILKHFDNSSPERILPKEYSFFLNSTLLSDMQQDALSQKAKSLADIKFTTELLIDEKVLRQLLLLEEMLPERFKRICQNMQENTNTIWKDFINSEDPYKLISSEGLELIN